MKKAILIFLLFASMSLCFSQTYKKGQKTFSPGFGLGLYQLGYGLGFTLPVVANFDFGIHEHISVGAYGGFWSSSVEYSFNSSYRFSSTHIGLRGSFHFWQLLEEALGSDLKANKFDVYFTPWIGYNTRSAKWARLGNSFQDINWGNRIQAGAQLGARLYFRDNLAFFTEWGGTPTSWSNWGLTFRF
jgi:hypothetical protein